MSELRDNAVRAYRIVGGDSATFAYATLADRMTGEDREAWAAKIVGTLAPRGMWIDLPFAKAVVDAIAAELRG